MHNQIVIVMLFLYTGSISSEGVAKTYAVLGETGCGKSTFITNVFDNSSALIGHSLKSCTYEIDYILIGPKAHEYFRGNAVFDTVGLRDTEGRTDAEILAMIEFEYLRHFNDTKDASITAFTLILNTKGTRTHVKDDIAQYSGLFQPDFIKSLVILINVFDDDNPKVALKWEKEISQEVNIVSNEICKGCRIPVVTMNCAKPTEEQINDYIAELKRLPPYKLTELSEKQLEIAAIEAKMIANPENFKEEVVQKVKKVMKKKQELKILRTPQVFTNSRYVEGGTLLGLIPLPGKTVEEKVTLEVDKVENHTIEVEEPETYDVTVKMLKNSPEFYKQLAIDKYWESFRTRFVRNIKKKEEKEELK